MGLNWDAVCLASMKPHPPACLPMNDVQLGSITFGNCLEKMLESGLGVFKFSYYFLNPNPSHPPGQRHTFMVRLFEKRIVTK